MSRTMRLLRPWCSLGVFFCIITDVVRVDAYILPPRFYLRKMVSVRSSMRQLTVWMTIETPQDGSIKREEAILRVRAPGQIRLEHHKNKKAHRVEVWRNQEYLFWEQGAQTKNTSRKANPRFDFFAVGGDGSSWGRIEEILRASGVRYEGSKRLDSETDYNEPLRMSLAWFGGRPVIVLGAPFGDRKPNQLWLDKEHAYPVRFLGKMTSGGALDIRFLDYHRDGRGYLFPGRIEIYRAGRLFQRMLAYRIRVGSVPQTSFQQVP